MQCIRLNPYLFVLILYFSLSMINMKKLLAVVSAFAVAASVMFVPSVGAQQYTADAEYVAAYNWMFDNGLTSTTSPEAFNPG